MNIFTLFTLFGGLGMFLLGMDMMGEGLKRAAGESLKTFLDKMTNNPLKGIALGTIVTMIIQSSSATGVMVIGLANAGLIGVYQAAGVMLGANIGTTITGQLIALNASAYAPLFIAIGVSMRMFCKKERSIDIGNTVLGFGILFLGISTMSSSMRPLVNNQQFANMLVTFGNNPLLGAIAGTVFTAIIQSSSASVGLLQTLALGGAFASIGGTDVLDVVTPIILGMNLGACAPFIISTIGANMKGKQVAFSALLFKVLGLVWFMVFLIFTDSLSSQGSIFYNFIIKISGNDVSKQIANSHTIYNILNTIVIYPFIKPLVKFIERIYPDNESDDDENFVLHLDDRMLDTPSVALSETMDEVYVMGKVAKKNLERAYMCFKNEDLSKIDKVLDVEDIINRYETGITTFLVKISSLNLTFNEARLSMHLYNVIHHIERIGDHAVSVVNSTRRKVTKKIKFSEGALSDIDKMYNEVNNGLDLVLEAFKNRDTEKARKIHRIELKVNRYEKEARDSHIRRLNQGTCSPESGVLYLDLITDLERIGDYIEHIAEFIENDL